MKNIKVLGIDLAKNVFQLHGIDEKGVKILSKRVSRAKLVEVVAKLKPGTIAIEACGGAHHWGRVFQEMGCIVKMMSPQFVKPYVKSNKNDANDAAAIAEAATRQEMRFVPVKTLKQQDMLLSHRARQLAVKQRTAQANQIRGLLSEYGIILSKGISYISTVPDILKQYASVLSPVAQDIFKQLHEQFEIYDKQVASYDKHIETTAKQDDMCKELMKIEGIGPLTATAAIATIGDANTFKKGREVSAWLGLTPRQHSSGNTTRLGSISKRGDRYLRTLLIHGARSVVRVCDDKTDSRSLWIKDKKKRRGQNKAAVALANKNARIIWAILTTGECYRPAEVGQAITA